MIQSTFKNIEISGITTAVPENREILLEQYADVFGEDAVKQFSKTTGVIERRIALPEQTASDLSFVAAKELLKQKDINADDIGIVIFVTQTPDYLIPSTACVLHKRLSLSKDCIAFDINLGCSGYVYGIHTICAVLQSINKSHGLLLVGDTSNKGISPNDKSAAMLFGESGSATLLKKTQNTNEIKTALRTDGSGYKAIIVPAGASRNRNACKERTVWGDGNERSDYDLYMNGVDVFGFTISEVPSLVNDFLVETGKDRDKFDLYAFHQANCYILKQVMKRCKIPRDKFHISMDRYGNTSVTSIPLTICDKYGSETEKIPKNIFTCGFGIGLSWGAVSMSVNVSDIFPIIETNEYYTEGGVSHE